MNCAHCVVTEQALRRGQEGDHPKMMVLLRQAETYFKSCR